ncbi:efflux RND transporter periplasmic adaptor subunit [Fluoribacter dumoffii]|uniref:Cation efflux system protein CzcB n=1 Tax=Fluoribacter dumoffii TaxID=463 RepID=A0A377G5E9_9GAMM|nr:efflux RND transporter periplasmic adaptor subunit [Fluoribacter dumoffii]KTC91560.1 membrane-fusion protein AcrA [Fluoribacter dumoffii NY 23]MCW8387316.1 efflux RND transporter periplasmic adaptor subunit [Fluoribacter dumoffii]MCW8417177.1 efflux RND transporter periplasmic adaptor subunit [Fluoribacter dumoffii]MCW8454983.1 efflux RND transporter periplasmic adaptor subunit [Fluoribacter dumoffii]MCW8460940.1 efflux RND transporter periplasmic adaptor subunit [Fluoribacter dumoffii]
MNSYFKKSKWVILLLSGFLLFSCGHHEKQKKVALHHYKVEEKTLHKTLHFTGTVQPLHEHTITSPIEAVVETMNFHYGQLVKKGDMILTLNSTELQRQFNETLTEYLKAKDSYTIAKAKFVGTQDLWDSGLLSKNNYMSEKSNVNTGRVTLMQSTRKLTEMLEKLDENTPRNLSTLSLADFDKIKNILAAKHNVIRLKSPGEGILLYPPKAGEDKSARVTVGSTVKSGQVIGLIGDLSGIRIEIDVPEIDITQIQTGMNATVSGVAFGKYQLKGELVTVNAQASMNNGLPFFTAVIEVRNLTPEQQKWIKVGMSASIELTVDNGKQLLVPIAAIKREKGQSVVRVQTSPGVVEKRMITTGAAQADSVVVETGLKVGDVVVYE